MKAQIGALAKERAEKELIIAQAHARVKELDVQIRKLRTLEKKMNAVLGGKLTVHESEGQGQ